MAAFPGVNSSACHGRPYRQDEPATRRGVALRPLTRVFINSHLWMVPLRSIWPWMPSRGIGFVLDFALAAPLLAASMHACRVIGAAGRPSVPLAPEGSVEVLLEVRG